MSKVAIQRTPQSKEKSPHTSQLDQIGIAEGLLHRQPFAWALAPEAGVAVMPSDDRLVMGEEEGLVKGQGGHPLG